MPDELLVLGVDPGKTTGYAVVSFKNGKVEPTGTLGADYNGKINSIKSLLDGGEIGLVVIENFKLRPHMARKGAFDRSEMIAPKVIGKLEDACEDRGIKFVKQEASDKPAGFALAGMKYVPGKKGTHWQDALAHATLYCVRHFGASPVKREK